MKTLKVTEKKRDLGFTLLGIEDDGARSAFDAMVSTLNANQITVFREYSYDPSIAVPVLECEGSTLLQGRYPSVKEVAQWFDLPESAFGSIRAHSPLFEAANITRIGACCGVGTDVYCDPNEDGDEQ